MRFRKTRLGVNGFTRYDACYLKPRQTELDPETGSKVVQLHMFAQTSLLPPDGGDHLRQNEDTPAS